MKKGICIGGYAGCGNIGDDAILQGYLKRLEQEKGCGIRREITVLSGSPSRDTKRFGVRCVNRKNPFSVLRALLRSERFLCGGGSLLQNATGKCSLPYYLALLQAARMCGCRVELLAAGIGPLNGALARRRTAAVLNRCTRIDLRDTDSYRALVSMGVRRELMSISPDPALFMPKPPPSRLPFLLNEAGISHTDRYFCVALLGTLAEKAALRRTLTAALRLFSRQHGLTPVFVLFDSRRDLSPTLQMCRELRGTVARLREPSDAVALLSGCELLLGMRLHALIFSAVAQAPAVGLGAADPKLGSFCRSAGIPYFHAEEVNAVSLVHALEECLRNRDRIRATLPSTVRELRESRAGRPPL